MIQILTPFESLKKWNYSPFDVIAADYDRIFSFSNIGRAQRQAVWQETDRLFQSGQEIFELNCGTGVDAIHLARCGLHVFAIDQSANMIKVARNRLNRTQFGEQVRLEQMTIEEIHRRLPDSEFDGAFSNFGGLNCIDKLDPVVRNLACLLKPGSLVLLCLMSRYCLWEWGYYLARFEVRKAFRRTRKGGTTASLGGQAQLQVYYHGVSSLVRVMQPRFRYLWHKALGLAVPPSYLEGWVTRHPVFLKLAQVLDTRISHWPLLRSLGDHTLICFQRR